MDIDPDWTREVMADCDMVALEPGPQLTDGRLPVRRSLPLCTRKDSTMAKTVDAELISRLHEESEHTKDDPYPTGTQGKRPNRSQVYSVRLSAEEQARVQRVADAKHLPASTLVRSWILERLDHESA